MCIPGIEHIIVLTILPHIGGAKRYMHWSQSLERTKDHRLIVLNYGENMQLSICF